jgi:hypothetical protein
MNKEAVAAVREPETKQEKLARLKKAYAKKNMSLPILIQESDLWDWNPTRRMLLLVIALGTRREKEDYSDTFIQKDCPLSAEEAVGYCDMAQWRLAGRVGITEDYTSELLNEFEAEGVLHIERWEDENGTRHNMYKINEAVVREHQRPEQKRGMERPPRYKVKRKANNTSFSHANQPGKNREVREMDDEE